MTEADLTSHRIEGIARHGNKGFSVPLISHVAGNLFQGGCIDGVPLPESILHVVSLYPWERYAEHEGVLSSTTVRMYDSAEGPDETLVWLLAAHVNRLCAHAPTLVHCQAGLNRSGMIAGLALRLNGLAPQSAVDLLRSRRSPAVLCNATFEAFVLESPVTGGPS